MIVLKLINWQPQGIFLICSAAVYFLAKLIMIGVYELQKSNTEHQVFLLLLMLLEIGTIFSSYLVVSSLHRLLFDTLSRLTVSNCWLGKSNRGDEARLSAPLSIPRLSMTYFLANTLIRLNVSKHLPSA